MMESSSDMYRELSDIEYEEEEKRIREVFDEISRSETIGDTSHSTEIEIERNNNNKRRKVRKKNPAKNRRTSRNENDERVHNESSQVDLLPDGTQDESVLNSTKNLQTDKKDLGNGFLVNINV